jgi:hypothetical protein
MQRKFHLRDVARVDFVQRVRFEVRRTLHPCRTTGHAKYDTLRGVQQRDTLRAPELFHREKRARRCARGTQKQKARREPGLMTNYFFSQRYRAVDVLSRASYFASLAI